MSWRRDPFLGLRAATNLVASAVGLWFGLGLLQLWLRVEAVVDDTYLPNWGVDIRLDSLFSNEAWIWLIPLHVSNWAWIASPLN